MARLMLSRWGRMIGTRRLGEEVRREIMASLQAQPGPVEIDFSGVESLSWSFADECFGLLEESIGREDMKARLRWVNMDTPDLGPVIRAVLQERRSRRCARPAQA